MAVHQVDKSYADFGLVRSFRQIGHALRHRRQWDDGAARLLERVRRDEARMHEALGCSLENMCILEIGPGQNLARARYFGRKNAVVGLDLDVVPTGSDVGSYLRMVRKNGLGRMVKTIGRKLLVERQYDAAWARAIGVRRFRDPEVLHGDIGRVAPAREAYDAAFSWSVFEHLPNPRKALENVVGALRPGGLAYISIHLYTSISGHHDIRAFSGQLDRLPPWGHLRPAHQHAIRPSAFLNEWRLAQWRDLFTEVMPGHAEFLEEYDTRAKMAGKMTSGLRRELAGYDDEELFTVDAVYCWRKPSEGVVGKPDVKTA